jgi:hypothetical protein
MKKRLVLLVSSALLLSCRPAGDAARSDEAVARGTGAAGAADVDTVPVDESVATPSSALANGAAPPVDTNVSQAAGDLAIPSQYQGRWGMVPADCQPGRSDAKGLITIDAKTIRFYEALGTLAEVRPAIATSFSGLFRYTGEGMNWTRVETLTRAGNSLTRATDEGSFRYTRCPD